MGERCRKDVKGSEGEYIYIYIKKENESVEIFKINRRMERGWCGVYVESKNSWLLLLPLPIG